MHEQRNDEHRGLGGSYLVGKDGKRQLVHRTETPRPQAKTPSEAPAPAAAEAVPSPATKKGAK